ncbi:MAG: helix-turn-helix domain-containing protein [Candidatus Muiribacteriota bacterium]
MHFGEKLYVLLKEKGMTQRALADELDVNVQAINRYIKSDRQPRISFIQKVAKTLKVPVTYFVNDYKDPSPAVPDEFDYDFVKLRVMGHIPKGWPLAAVREFMDEIFVHKRIVENMKVYALQANNNDMSPIIEPSDYVILCDEVKLKDGDVVGIRKHGDAEIKYRKYYKINDWIMFIPKNIYQEPEKIKANRIDPHPDKGDIEIMGKVVFQTRNGFY